MKRYFCMICLFCGFLPVAFAQEILPVSNDSIIQNTDSIAQKNDSIPKKTEAIDAPVQYASKDSMIMILDGHNMVYLFGAASVQYKDLNLTGERIEVDADSSRVYATFALDSVGEEFGYPIFKQGDTQYEMKAARYNFKSKKMKVTDVITQQGEGFVTASETKKMPNDDMYMINGRYTTCDDHEHPHFYLQMTKAKMRPKKNIVVGPAYLVVEDVPLPLAIPFGFFPFTDSYSSGVLMPTYGDEMQRGFSLRDGGYYFAINDYVDLALTGEIYTRGSWGLNAQSSYRKRYKFSGQVSANYRVTITGEKDEQDYNKSTDFRLNWTHSQDAKANPFSTFSASVKFSTSSYAKNDLTSSYSNDYTENTKSSTINYNLRPPGSPFSFNANTSINQTSKDTTLSVTLPNLTITMREVYPFQRKEQIGAPRWYENIRVSYNGLVANSIINVKEYDFFKKNLIKDWRNGVQHKIPISASFTLFKNITITPNVTYNERWYFSKVNQKYDEVLKRAVPADTTYGFYRIFDYSGGVSAQTKLYGMFKPLPVFGKWTEKTIIRHVFSPSVSFSGSPDFSDKSYGYYKDLYYLRDGQVDTISYSPYAHNLWGVPGRGKSGTMSFSIDNNLEMKVPIAGTDSTRKISLIDQFRVGMNYNFLADSMNWSDMSVTLRLKLFGKSGITLNGIFDTYTYVPDATNPKIGRRVNVPRWKAGKGFGRLRSTGASYSYTLNTESFKQLFALFSKKEDSPADEPAGSMTDADIESANTMAVDDHLASAKSSLRKPKEKSGEYDSDGYLMTTIPWNVNFSYSMSLGYGEFNAQKREYDYRLSHTLGISGSISPTKGWSLNFNTSYDFDNRKFATMQCSISRQMHCWSMSASVIPVGPYQSYNFTIAVNSSLLQDLKYTQSSNYRDSMNWGD
ncbi:MAG: LPS-assembly protein LptD [Dysgonamonadaceae bacterium]|nr:LPS-assembly protein LptD [Dysgonamonadaceae bacterium]